MNSQTTPVTTVAMSVSPDRQHACAAIAGDIDLNSEPALATLSQLLAESHCTTVHIDLREVTFAGSTLLNFVARLHQALPASATVSLCRSSDFLAHLITIADLQQIVSLKPGLPPTWTIPTPY